jgi:hypothetical protein
VSDVETLQELMTRRLREMGRRRGRDTLTLREVHESIKDDAGKAPVSYETARQILKGQYTSRLSDESADGLATMLDVSVSQVLAAAGQRPRLGRFALPRKADRLNDKERRAVLAVVDAILDASGSERAEESRPTITDAELDETHRIAKEVVARRKPPLPRTPRPGKKRSAS